MIVDEVLEIIRYNPGVTFRELRSMGVPQRFGCILPSLVDAGLLKRTKTKSDRRTGRSVYIYEIAEVRKNE